MARGLWSRGGGRGGESEREREGGRGERGAKATTA